MKISIVIISYNVKDFLEKCITSIHQNFSDAEIIVVDNNSADGTLEMLKNFFPEVKVIANKLNKGFSEANNQGMSVSTSDFILLLNPDTEIVGDALTKMLSFIDKQQLCIIGPKLLNADRTLQISAWKFPSVLALFLELLYLHKLFGILNYSSIQMKKVFEPDALSGAALLFKKELLNFVKGLDPIFFWMEDIDFCYRAKNQGAKIIYYPDAEIIHYSGKSSLKNQHIVIANQLISKLKFEKKHKNFLIFVIASIIIFLHIISRYFILLIPSIFSSSLKIKRKAYYFSLIKYFNFMSGDQHVIIR